MPVLFIKRDPNTLCAYRSDHNRHRCISFTLTIIRPEDAKIGADPTLIGAHKWLYSWETAVKKHRFQLIPLLINLIDFVWTGEGRIHNQEPLEILNVEFAGK